MEEQSQWLNWAMELQALAQAGDHIVAQKTIYGGSYNLLAHTLPQFGVETTFVDAHNLQEVAAAIRRGAGSFRDMFAPVLKLLDRTDSLEQLREMMEDEEAVAALYRSMDTKALETLLQKAMACANLEGRALEDGH